jgi:hypothetical protein
MDMLIVRCDSPAHFSWTTLHDYSDPDNEESFHYSFETVKTLALRF